MPIPPDATFNFAQDGGPAFASADHGWAVRVRGKDGTVGEIPWPGMSLRDWFAGHALAGFCLGATLDRQADLDMRAQAAYRIADAMLVVRAEGAEKK